MFKNTLAISKEQTIMNIELSRYKVKEGKSEKVREWIAFLNENKKDVLLTLEQEKMKVECIFLETIEGKEYLIWFSIQQENGKDILDSDNWIDKKHLEYWKECIDKEEPSIDLKPSVILIPKNIKKILEE